MPRLDIWTWLIWLSIAAGQVALVAAIAHGRQTRRTKSVFLFIGFRAAVSFALISVALMPPSDRSAALYFYIYWAAAAVTAGIRVWIITDLARAACMASAVLQRYISWTIPFMAVLLFAASFFLLGNAPVNYSSAMLRATVNFSRIVCFTWMAIFVLVAYCTDFLGIKWASREKKIAMGLALQASSESIVGWLLGVLACVSLLSNLQSLLYLFSLVIWMFAVMREKDESIPHIEDLRAMAAPYLATGQSLRGK